VSEAFGAAKEVKVGGLEYAYIQRFAGPAQTYARHLANVSVISQLPRFALEAIAFGGMLLVMLYLMAKSGSFASALPIIALYVFAGYRLMPALQQIYAALTQLRFAGPALDALHQDLMSLQPAGPNTQEPAMPLTQAITLNKIIYRYPNAVTPALKGISLTIPAKSTVGLVGATGSGKTTTVDLILGLLDAQEGMLAIDGQPIIEQNKRAWQRAIGYVPQQIYLADDTVAANIAFGIEPEHIDQVAVERAAKIANLHEFVTNDMPQGYATTVGERGMRLSGGQRQRIGIARALYHNPQVLILDEATSALDNLTEQAVMEAVHNLGHEITIILIAHRLGTVKECDQIFLLEKGELKGQGLFEELRQANESFKNMAANK
jgi:ABC-type multidrug transport system fused ATPase/permease subunit